MIFPSKPGARGEATTSVNLPSSHDAASERGVGKLELKEAPLLRCIKLAPT